MKSSKIIRLLCVLIYIACFAVIFKKYGFDSVFKLGLFLLSFLLSFFLQIIIHEAGHLVFGLLTGYGFISFRVSNFVLIKNNGKLHFKHDSIVGTGGQCLLSPPEYNHGNFPFVLYNMGGVIFNLGTSMIFAILCFCFSFNTYFKFFCFAMVISGGFYALSNGIPWKTKYVSNDGYNTRSFLKDKNARKAFWIALKMVEAENLGAKLETLVDKSLLEFSEDADLSNEYVTSVLVEYLDSYVKSGDFEKAKTLGEKLLPADYKAFVQTDVQLKIDLHYIDVVINGERDKPLPIEPKMLAKFNNKPETIRTLYADSLAKGKADEAETLKQSFEKLAATYPYASAIEAERKLMEQARNVLVG